MLTKEQRIENAAKCIVAIDRAKSLIKHGDSLRVAKCPGTKRTVTFECWDGPDSCWMVSKSGIDDYHPVTIDRINGKPVDIAAGWEQRIEDAKVIVAQQEERRKKKRYIELQQRRKNAHVPF